MADDKQQTVTFKVTRPNTHVFAPDSNFTSGRAFTGGTVELPKDQAERYVRDGVGEIVSASEARKAESEDKAEERTENPVNARRGPQRGTRASS